MKEPGDCNYILGQLLFGTLLHSNCYFIPQWAILIGALGSRYSPEAILWLNNLEDRLVKLLGRVLSSGPFFVGGGMRTEGDGSWLLSYPLQAGYMNLIMLCHYVQFVC